MLTRWLTGVFLLWLALTSQLEARYGGLADFGRVIARADLLHEAKVTRAGPRGLVSQVTKPSGQSLQNTAFDAEGHVLTQVYSNSGGTPTATVSMTYYSGGLLNSVTETDSGGAAASQCNFGYSTKYTDPDTGLVYYGHRWYDPQTGRWLSREPLGEMESPNLYEFCNDDPINNWDRLGLQAVPTWMVFLQSHPELNAQQRDQVKSAAEYLGLGNYLFQNPHASFGMVQGFIANALNPAAPSDPRIPTIRAASPETADAARLGIGTRMAQGNTLGALDFLFAIGTGTAVLQDAINPNEGWGIIGQSYNANIRTPFANGLGINQSDPVVGLSAFANNAALSTMLFSGANRLAPAAEASGMPAVLRGGQVFETNILAAQRLAKNTGVWRPTPAQIDSAAFKLIVGDARYTSSGLARGTIMDSVQGGFLEIKGGSSILDSTYQLRLQTYRSLIEDTPFTIQTTRPVDIDFGQWLNRWGVNIQAPPGAP